MPRTATRKRKTTARGRKTTTRRKTTARKATTRRATTRRKPRQSALLKSLPTTAIKQPFTKSESMAYIADHTELTKKQVSEVFEVLGNLIHRHLKKRGAGEFAIPGLLKCVVKFKPATKARKGINPFTGEPTTFKAKPSRYVVKVRPLKKLKEMAGSN